MEALTNNPDRDVTTIQVDLRLSTLKLRHAKVMTDMYQHLQSERGKEIIKAGRKAEGITDILKDARKGNGNTIRVNPTERYILYIIIKKFPQIGLKFVCFFFLCFFLY